MVGVFMTALPDGVVRSCIMSALCLMGHLECEPARGHVKRCMAMSLPLFACVVIRFQATFWGYGVVLPPSG